MNRFVSDDDYEVPILEVDPSLEADQKTRLRELRATRDGEAVDQALAEVERVAATDANLLPAIRQAMEVRATVGEVSDALRRVFGEYRPG